MVIDASAWLGLAGVAVGGFLALATGVFQDGRRQRHEERLAEQQRSHERKVRFEDRRFGAYVDLIASGNRVYAACQGYSGNGTGLDQVSAVHEQFIASLSPAFLITVSPVTHDKIASLARRVRDLVDAVGHGDVGGMPELLLAHRNAVKNLEQAMRDELGIDNNLR